MLDSFVLIFRNLCRTPSVTASAVPPPSRREVLVRAGNFPSSSKGSLREGAVVVRRLGELPKIFLHQRFFHQFQLFKALLYGLLLLVYARYKGGKLILKFNWRHRDF